MMTVEQLAKATGASLANAQRFHKPLLAAMDQFKINTPLRIAGFLATLSVESVRLTATEEDLYYRDAARLARIYPRAFKTPAEASAYVANPKKLGQLLYQGYWGRGLIQLTWKANYQKAATALGHDYVKSPELVASVAHAALTAAWYWQTNGCNAAADKDDMREITRLVNGSALMHLPERTDQFKVAKGVFA